MGSAFADLPDIEQPHAIQSVIMPPPEPLYSPDLPDIGHHSIEEPQAASSVGKALSGPKLLGSSRASPCKLSDPDIWYID